MHCTIGIAYHKVRRTSASCDQKEPEKFQPSTSVDSAAPPRGMFPSLMERAFLPQIVSQVRRHWDFLVFVALIHLLTSLYFIYRFQVTFRCHCGKHRPMIQT